MKEEFITWNDTLRYLNSFPYRFPITKDSLLVSSNTKKASERFSRYVESYIYEILKKYDAPKSYFENIAGFLVVNFDQEGNAYFSIDPVMYFTAYLYQITSAKVFDSTIKEKVFDVNDLYHLTKEDNNEDVKKALKRCFIDVRNKYNQIIENKSALLIDNYRGTVGDNSLIKELSDDLLWGIRNLKFIVDELNKPIGDDLFEFLSVHIDKVKLIEYVTYISIGSSGFFRNDLDDSEFKTEFADVVNNYKYLYAILKQIYPEYNNNIAFENEENTKTNYSSSELCEIVTTSEKLKDCDVSTNSMNEFLENIFMDYNNSTIEYNNEQERIRLEEEKKKKVEDFRKEILLSWELIPEAETKTGYGSTRSISIPRTDAEKQIIEEKKEKVLNDKIYVFEGSNYLARLKGVNKFEGYEAFVYPDGKVLLEKFYKNTRNGLEPVYNEALYIMTIDKFQEFSKYTKTELRDIKKTDPSLNTINHSKNFVKRVQAILDGIDYDELTLEYIDTMIEGLKNDKGLNK